MTKICTIFTGGTIGSRVNEHGRITTADSSTYQLLEEYRQHFHDVTFRIEEPYYILSEQLCAADIKKLIHCVAVQVQEGDLDGVIVTHGTDTLQYSAAMLSYLFGDVSIPIVLVSSDYPLQDSRANGFVNFQYAVEFIKGQFGTGVFVSYCNQGGIPVIHRGTRLLQHLPFSADVNSVEDSWYGRFEAGTFVANPRYRVRSHRAALLDDVDAVKLTDCADSVMRIVPYAGMTYPILDSNTKAVLHESYHSGTIAVNASLKRFMEQAESRQVPVFLTGLPEQQNVYETVDRYRELGIQPLCESAPIAQYCKLWLAVSNGLDVKKTMRCCIAEDFV